MSNQHPTISPSQLFCVLILSRLSAEAVYPRTASATALEAILAVVIAEAVRFLLALPVIIYSWHGNNIHRAVYSKNKALGWTGAVFAAILLFAAAARTIFNTAQFAMKNLLPHGAVWLIFIFAAGFAVYSAFMGVEGLARSGAIFLIAAALITLTVALADIPYMGVNSFLSLIRFEDGSSIVGDVIERVFRGGDYLIFAALLPYVSRKDNGSLGKTGLSFALVSAVLSAAVTVMNCLVLRELYGRSEFPFLAAASLADISLFKRLDGLAAAVWSLCAAFRSGVLLLSAGCAVKAVYTAKITAQKQGG